MRLPSKVTDGQKPPQEKNPRKTPWRNEPPQYATTSIERSVGSDAGAWEQHTDGTDAADRSRPGSIPFPTAAAFCSWLRLCPDPKISGGQVLSSRTRPTKNRAALALRMGAPGLHHSQSFLGDYFRRMKARMGSPKAMTAAAHKLARIVYHMVANQQEYDATVFQEQEQRTQDRKRAKLYANRPKSLASNSSLFLRRAPLPFRPARTL